MNSQHNREKTSFEGLQRVLVHAMDMNKDGQLNERELAVLKSYLFGQVNELQSMDDYVASRQNGQFDQVAQGVASGMPDDMGAYDAKQEGWDAARKVAANFVGRLWEAGHIDDATYKAEMQKAKMTPPSEGVTPADAPEPDAMTVWQGANDAAAPTETDSEASGGDQIAAVSSSDVAEFKARSGGDE